MVIQRGDAYTNPETVTVAGAQPQTKDQSGKGQGAISDASGALYEPGNPASAGSVLTIFCAGLGEVTPAVEAGRTAYLRALRNLPARWRLRSAASRVHRPDCR